MYSILTDAPCNAELTIINIGDTRLEAMLSRMGIYPKSIVTRLDEDVALHAVRVRCEKGEVVLSGGMGGKIVAHLDDGRMLPLTEMQPGEQGHIEAITAGHGLLDALELLGLKSDENITMIRRLPSMEYIASLEGRGRVRMAEGMAAKIYGRLGKMECQFANAQADTDFHVTQILGGERARRAITSLGIAEGSVLRLEYVEKAPSYRMMGSDRLLLTSKEGLRLFLRNEQADSIMVQFEGTQNQDGSSDDQKCS